MLLILFEKKSFSNSIHFLWTSMFTELDKFGACVIAFTSLLPFLRL